MLQAERAASDTPSSAREGARGAVHKPVPRLIVVIGVCGCGKSTLGTSLAKHLKKPFLDADDFHTPENKDKMARGIPLTDADRWPWLDTLARAIAVKGKDAGMAVAACSALRRAYRERLVAMAGEPILFVMLEGSRELIAERLASRTGHFMPPAMLDSQLATLEPPQDDEQALKLDISQPMAAMVKEVHDHLFSRR
ncbi:MAG: gluconokinase [Pseudomonadota bacterium]